MGGISLAINPPQNVLQISIRNLCELIKLCLQIADRQYTASRKQSMLTYFLLKTGDVEVSDTEEEPIQSLIGNNVK